MNNHEIERKFLIHKDDLPADLGQYEARRLMQGYLCSKPTVRVRKEDASYYLTYKGRPSEDGLDRVEYNLPLEEASFQTLLEKCDGTVISKTRYYIPYAPGEGQECVIELDVFDAPFEGLYYAEVEFEDVKSAQAFVKPAWFGKEVTDLSDFSYAVLARTGRMPEDV